MLSRGTALPCPYNCGGIKMKSKSLLSFLGAVLLVSAASEVYAGVHPSAAPPSAQTPAQTPAKKSSASSRSKRRRRAAKPKGQKTPTADRIKEIQTALQREGVYQGQPNGKWDDATVEAMKKYQDKNGI